MAIIRIKMRVYSNKWQMGDFFFYIKDTSLYTFEFYIIHCRFLCLIQVPPVTMDLGLLRVFVFSKITRRDLVHFNINLWYLNSRHITDLGF